MNDQGMEWWQTVGIHEAQVKEEYESWCDERRQEAIERCEKAQKELHEINEWLEHDRETYHERL